MPSVITDEQTQRDDASDVIDHSSEGSKFHAEEGSKTIADIQHASEPWATIVSAQCRFSSDIFVKVMLNLVLYPNVTSSLLVRADITYDNHNDEQTSQQGLVEEDCPRSYVLPGWTVDRTIVRRLIPRNSQLDRALLQTCIFFSKTDNETSDERLVVYIPHVSGGHDMPYYHPAVEKLAFHYKSPRKASSLGPGNDTGNISISYQHFYGTGGDSRLDRTALKLLQTVHKHGEGELQGYEKKVHHDQVISQKRYQDTYARLKAKYGRSLSEGWVEVTDPGKHVFEDIGIAAFCIELWKDMYANPDGIDGHDHSDAVAGAESQHGLPVDTSLGAKMQDLAVKTAFPGFVDIGCGNGLLVYILLSEGYSGSGFDARERKTWSTFPPNVRQHLRQQLLVPSIFQSGATIKNADTWHNGIFRPGTFIISNHADELTAWTPLLAYLNKSASLAIPCCSHDLAGARFRAPVKTKAQKASSNNQDKHEHPARLPQQQESPTSPEPTADLSLTQAAETGSLKRTLVQKKMSSAYSTLCSYLVSLTETVGFEAEREVLRIPSTRNHCVVGRRQLPSSDDVDSFEVRAVKVIGLVEQELGRNIGDVGREWIERAEKLGRKPGSGH